MTMPVPVSHKTFEFGAITIDSNFDSGNCGNAEKVNGNTFNIWIAPDHPKTNYRTWFHFSVAGANRGATLSFRIKNMQNQSKLLYEGLVPVYREESAFDWKRIKEKINTSQIEFNQGWIEWTFRHTVTTNEKVFLAFFYPWSLTDNDKFLASIETAARSQKSLYFHRTVIARSLEGRPIEMLTISSTSGLGVKDQPLNSQHLFPQGSRPKSFPLKKAIVFSARVHPGQVPGSHVMTGIIKQLLSQSEAAEVLTYSIGINQSQQRSQILLNEFVFYMFPILNPDGVSRGHYRVDTNGINLNRCYLNPDPQTQSSIYAIKNIVMHLHGQGRFFAYMDLHAHASRKGTFIYGNSVNELLKQVDACILPKILSYNSENFEYEGSNFTEKNMYCKDKADHISKEGSGRVALFKATKNPYCWTLECNYNMSRVNTVLQPVRTPGDALDLVNQNNLNGTLITTYRNPDQQEAKDFFTIQIYHKLGKQILVSFLDLVGKNPSSRLDNPKGYWKSVHNLKMNLALALLRMAPGRFESNFKKIYYGLENQANQLLFNRSVKALYLIVIKRATISDMKQFLKEGDESSVSYPKTIRPRLNREMSYRPRQNSCLVGRSSLTSTQLKLEQLYIQAGLPLKGTPSLEDLQSISPNNSKIIMPEALIGREDEAAYISGSEVMIRSKLQSYDFETSDTNNGGQLFKVTRLQVPPAQKVELQVSEFRMIGLSSLRGSTILDGKKPIRRSDETVMPVKLARFRVHGLPSFKIRDGGNENAVQLEAKGMCL